MDFEKLHGILAKQGIRLFNLTIDNSTTTYIHTSKTVQEWRDDVRDFIKKSHCIDENDGYATYGIWSNFNDILIRAGYVQVTDIVSDVYEGRIASTSSCIMDDPAHEEQQNGFGHYGWESKI